jgi:hypothetical protein
MRSPGRRAFGELKLNEDTMENQRDDTRLADANNADADRRTFLAALGRFSVVTPPAITLLLSTTLASKAIAHSGGGEGHHDHHDHWDQDWSGPSGR